jgi:hypothetical protein
LQKILDRSAFLNVIGQMEMGVMHFSISWDNRICSRYPEACRNQIGSKQNAQTTASY